MAFLVKPELAVSPDAESRYLQVRTRHAGEERQPAGATLRIFNWQVYSLKVIIPFVKVSTHCIMAFGVPQFDSLISHLLKRIFSIRSGFT